MFSNLFKKSDKPSAAVFVDYEHWYYGYNNIFSMKPNVQEWYDELTEEYNVKKLMFFGDFNGSAIEKELPKLDDEFAKDVSEFDTLKELKASIKEKLEKENEDRVKFETQDMAVKAVCDNTEIDIPSGMIETEIDNMVNDMKTRLQYQGLTLDSYLSMIGKTESEFRKDYEEQAKEAVKSRLVIEAIVKKEKIEASDKDVTEKLEEMAKNYGKEAKELEQNEALKNFLKGSLETEKAIEFVVKNAKIK